MTFENFYAGNSYAYEFAVAKTIADRPCGEYSPLIIFGPYGVGKTHLLSAIECSARALYKNQKIIRISADDFVEELIESICKGKSTCFHEKYDTADMLLIDNFELVAGKEHTQEELFKIFDNYTQNKKQIVLCISGNLREYDLAQKIKSRLSNGIFLEMNLPDDKTKYAIVNGIAKELRIELEEQLKIYLVEKTSNAAEINGMLKTLKMVCEITNECPSLDKLKHISSQLKNSV